MEVKRVLRVLALILAWLPAWAAAAGTDIKLDPAPINPADAASLQSGARTYVNYCLSCHGLSALRYNQLTKLGITEQQIRDNLLFTGQKTTELVKTALRPEDARDWFGAPPPDLSVISRVRGADWLYSYLRGFYRDSDTATGWNNLVFKDVGMPHVLAQLQGERVGKWVTEKDSHGHEVKRVSVSAPSGGSLPALEYDRTIADLVNFMVWVGEPHATDRKRVGYYVLIVLGILMFLSYLLKVEYWKDVH